MKTRNIWMGIALLLSSLLLAGCGGDSGGTTPAPAPAPAPAPTPPPPPPEPDPEPEAEMRTYDIQFRPIYSTNALFLILGAQLYPEGASADSRIAFVAHPRDTMLWEEGGIASEGLKMLAETGASAGLVAEAGDMEFVVLADHFDTIVALLGAQEITLSADFPCLTYAQRLMPNADWFFGFANVCALDADGNWVETLDIRVEMYDAGTAEGEAYMEATGPTDPQMPIARVMVPPWDTDAVSEITGTLQSE